MAKRVSTPDVLVEHKELMGEDAGYYVLQLLTPAAEAWADDHDLTRDRGGVPVAARVIEEIRNNLAEHGLEAEDV